MPLFGFYYLNLTEKFEAKVILPQSVDINYSISKSFRLGLNFKGQLRTYNVNTPIELETDLYIVKSAQDIYSYCQYETKGGLNFQLGFGRSLGRSYRIYNDKISFALPLFTFGDDREQLNTDFSDSWLFKVAFAYLSLIHI